MGGHTHGELQVKWERAGKSMATMWSSTAAPGATGHTEGLSIQCGSGLGFSQILGMWSVMGAVKHLKGGGGWARGRPLGRDSKANRISRALLGKCALLVIAI